MRIRTLILFLVAILLAGGTRDAGALLAGAAACGRSRSGSDAASPCAEIRPRRPQRHCPRTDPETVLRLVRWLLVAGPMGLEARIYCALDEFVCRNREQVRLYKV
jgi:hypothetical protein